MNCDQIGAFMDEGLSLRHALLMRFLCGRNGAAYAAEVVEATGLSPSFILRCYQKDVFFQRITMAEKHPSRHGHPIKTGISLTPRSAALGATVDANIRALIDAGLGLRHYMLIVYLLESGDAAYVRDIVTDTGLQRQFVERCWEEKEHLFQHVLMPPVTGDTRPFTVGVRLTVSCRNLIMPE